MSRSEPGSAPPLPRQFRPLGVRVAVLAFIGLLFLTTAVIWVSFPDDIRSQFTLPQKITIVLFGAIILAIGHALARCRVDADGDGITVVNGYRSRRYEWAELVAVTLRPGSPWAVIDLADGTSQPAVGIQGSDGGRAMRQVRELRSLIDAHAGAEPPAGRSRDGDGAAGDGDEGDDEPS